MKRREFIKIALAAAFVWPLAVRAEMPVIGYLSARSPEDTAHLVEAFRKGLSEAGFVEGQNVTVEYRWARGQQDRLPDLAADLVRKPVTVLVSTGGEAAALAAKGKTSTIPIAFIIGGDPVNLGLVASYQRPGANATGITILTATLEPKRLELLRQLLPNVSTVAALLDPKFPPYEAQLRDLREAARALDLHNSQTPETIASQKIGAVIVVAGPFFDTRRDKIVALAARHAVPTMYHFREFAEAGGLISYGIDSTCHLSSDRGLRWRNLKGEKPAELPVRQPTKFELVINLKTAKALGLKIPVPLQVAADDVIE